MSKPNRTFSGTWETYIATIQIHINKAYIFERFAGGGITQAEWSVFSGLTLEATITEAVSTLAEFPKGNSKKQKFKCNYMTFFK